MSWLFDAPPVPLARLAVQTAVFRYHADESDPSRKWEAMPNLRFLGMSAKEGAAPWTARIRYAQGDPFGADSDPDWIEQVVPYDAFGPGVLAQDDQIVAFAFFADGSRQVLFSGFVQAPQGDLGSDGESITVSALGDTVRESDYKLAGAVVRDADKPLDPDGDTQTGSVPTRFNPDGRPNASPQDPAYVSQQDKTDNEDTEDQDTEDDAGDEVSEYEDYTGEDESAEGDSGDDPNTYPVFLGPFSPDNLINGQTVRAWTLPMAARYLYMIGARTPDGRGGFTPSKYVVIDDISYFDSALQAMAPVADNDAGPIDPTDPSTYVFEDIDCPDVDVTGMPWPEALWRIIEPYGFGMSWVLSEDDSGGDEYPGNPVWTLDLYRKEWSNRQKSVYLQSAGGDLDPSVTNIHAMTLSRDATGLANQVEIDAAPIRIESSFVLAPGFQIAAELADIGLSKFTRGDPGFTGAAKTAYREFIFDECGEGHLVFNEGNSGLAPAVSSHDIGDFTDAFPTAKQGQPKQYWALRRRPGIPGKLITVGNDAVQLRPKLYISFDYDVNNGDIPGIWNGEGTWWEITSGEWELMEDRLGVRLTMQDPDKWAVGGVLASTTPQMQGTKVTLKLVTWFSQPSADFHAPTFMLVCCVDMDDDFNVSSPRRAASPTKYTTVSRVDAKERFKKTIINKWSYFAKDHTKDTVVTDDTDAAQALADMYRRSSEYGEYAGPAKIRRFTAAYGIGDQITDISGRDLSLQANGAAEQGEAPVYPAVVGIDWEFDSEQSTTLTLSDHRVSPPPRHGGRRRR